MVILLKVIKEYEFQTLSKLNLHQQIKRLYRTEIELTLRNNEIEKENAVNITNYWSTV